MPSINAAGMASTTFIARTDVAVAMIRKQYAHLSNALEHFLRCLNLTVKA